ncbi:hypothetical protein F4781DRAFT_97731 [Annulohypoxylon bovei var. microspora]|nr:hypothetical protein F4781DRAFT_97731 [Annulohypoxylon bovei var. microspora]
MDSQETPLMSPHLAGPAAPVPVRTSSKRALEAMPTNTLTTKRSDLSQLIKKRRKGLRPTSSHDSDYWSSHMEVLQMEKDLHEYSSIITYREQTKGSESNLSYREWLHSVDVGLELGRKKSAIDLKLSMAESQATRMGKHHPLLESWIKLFFGAASGFGLGAASYGPRDNAAQSKMRREMFQKYHEVGIENEMPDHVWEPVFGAWFRSDSLHAAHLYPSKSIEHMDLIFGKGAKDELMTAANGLFLCPDIEKLMELGYVAIVPDVRLEPDAGGDSAADMQLRREYVKDWEKTNPKEYKLIVLDNTKRLVKELRPIFVSPLYDIKSVEDIHGRRLKFRTDFRPRARYMWWAYLNSIVSFSYRYKGTAGIGIDGEVELGNRYWGTRGRYVKKNQLLGFIEHVGQDISSIRSSSLLENALEEEGEDDKPDPSALVVMADTTIRQTSTSLRGLGVGDESDDSDGSEPDEADDDSEAAE